MPERRKNSPDPITSSGSPVLEGGQTYDSVTGKIGSIVLARHTPRGWIVGFAISFFLLMVMLWSIFVLLTKGIGIWGVNIPVAWGFAIINFVWWIGIGHAGTFISAILLLLHQEWRTSINRFAEAMTLFAVACAGLFPLLHLGRPQFFYWLLPYPNTMGLWPQFRSPLVWDVFAVGTYFTISLLFWYVGLIPDLATLRDRARNRLVKITYGLLAMGWRGSARHWHRYQMAYLLLAGLATPLVISVHSVVSLDFAVSQVPGWHVTIFPPYFVAGAIFSGFAMVLVLMIPLRWAYGLQGFVTTHHLDVMGKVMLATGLIVAYGYLMEIFMSFYSTAVYEQTMALGRLFGPYAWSFWMLLVCNVAAAQLLWIRRVRQSPWLLFTVAMIINLGMWLERFVIVITSLNRNHFESMWRMYYPTWWDWTLLFGSIGLFVSLLFLFIRVLPMISIFEVRELVTATSGPREGPAAYDVGEVEE